MTDRLYPRRTASAPLYTSRPTNRFSGAEATMKRFWDTVGIETRGGALGVTLDGRTLKTPAGNPLLLPPRKTLLATLIAAEWDHQEKLLKPHTLPMTSIATRALDALVDASTRAEVQRALLNYLDTDTICFHEDYPPPLTKEKLGAVLAGFDHWEMAVEQAALAAQVEVASQIERWGEVEDTHDVDYHDVRRQLGSVACLLSNV
ncbi:hypothetical protein BD779DRAFT_1502408 [Infundibulicybe gibba]|nr:hypothetical protein BD779DRAFT_1502408 [Infundibulicybe gibba]